MPEPTRSWLRIVVPAAVVLVGVGVFFAVLKNTKNAATQTIPATPTSPGTHAASQPANVAASTPASAPAPTPASPAPSAPSAQGLDLSGLHIVTLPDDPAPLAPLGSIDPASGSTMRLEFSKMGAGVSSIDLASYYTTIARAEHFRVQQEESIPAASGAAPSVLAPLAVSRIAVARSGETTATEVPVSGYVGEGVQHLANAWRQTAPGVFEATIANAADQPIVRLRREYQIKPGSYVITLLQSAANLSGQPLDIRWDQFAGLDLPYKVSYGGDKRRVRFGYQYKPEAQKGDPTVLSQLFLWPHNGGDVLGPKSKTLGVYDVSRKIWPNARGAEDGLRLVWSAFTAQYFGVAAFPITDPAKPDKTWPGVAEIYRLLLNPAARDENLREAMFLVGKPVAVAPGASGDFSLNIFAGPMDKHAIARDPAASDAGLSGMIAYNMGGACAPCTFEILTTPLIGLLRILHNYVLHDWALSIMFLVLIVRTILHPVTRWSQVRMQRFGKQMGDMAPKQKKLQEKYAGDPQKLREEMAKLWREEGVNPAGMLGCLPMMLQTPVWIALFATLSFAIELRHQPAFFGVFQKATGGTWKFLGDLADADHFITLPGSFHLPLMGDISSVNLLPIVLGVVFWIQQKYLTPPTTTQLTPEQETQQKMMKYMMVLLFPLMMYNAPSGLALYFITNSTLGILESRWIRAHIKKHDLLAPKKKTGGGGGFMARLQTMAEERQKQMLKSRGMPPPAKRRK
jgi:YidC/Oxa1 family membrane protein insertase